MLLPLANRAMILIWLLAPACVPAQSTSETRHLPSLYAAAILEAAKQEAERSIRYIEEYHVLKYPGGDVPEGTGVCSDLVVRAFGNAGVDLQKELHGDRKAHPDLYPTKIWSYKKPDRNIDHRRCQNLVVWIRRFTKSLPVSTDPEALKSVWQSGDIVFYVRPGASHPWHVAIVSNRRDPDGMPRIIDAFPPATSEDHRLDLRTHPQPLPPGDRSAEESVTIVHAHTANIARCGLPQDSETHHSSAVRKYSMTLSTISSTRNFGT